MPQFQITAFSLPSLAAMLVAGALFPYVWRHRAAPGGLALAVMLSAVVWWAGGQVLGTMATTIPGKFLAAQVQYPGIVALPTAWFLFCLRYTGTLGGLYANWPVLLPIPAVTLLLALTNGWHHWLWADATLVEVGPFLAWELHYGPWFPVHRWWSYLLIGVGTIALLHSLLASPWHRRRAMLVVAAPLFPVAANLVYLAPESPIAWLDLTPAGFVAAGAAFTLALRGDLLDLVPLSRERVVLDMPDAVFVIGPDGRVIDMNPAAERLAARCGRPDPGRPLWDLLPMARSAVESGLDPRQPQETVLEIDGEETAWRISTSELADPRGELSGRVLIFHDTTERWRAERELRATTEALTAANRELTRLVTLDPLTRALQRAAFLRQAQEELQRARRNDRELTLLTLRLDNLAELNREAGSDVADQVLRALARLLESMRRGGDVLGRTGAGEFTLLLSEAGGGQAERSLEDIRRGIARSRFRNTRGRPLALRIRHGWAELDDEVNAADELLTRASRAAEGAADVLLEDRPACPAPR